MDLRVVDKETRNYEIIASQEWFDKWEALIKEYEDSVKVKIKREEDTIDNYEI